MQEIFPTESKVDLFSSRNVVYEIKHVEQIFSLALR